MADLDPPGRLRILLSSEIGQREVARRPVLRVAARGDDLPVALEVDAGAVRAHQVVPLQLRHPAPAVRTTRLEVRQAGAKPRVSAASMARKWSSFVGPSASVA